ncbi:hypothetical protein [uncultured Rhodoblastus sp.]|uniref:hypothetical protein n=1 Tax=uncultured Rhodoblastus sp. TaxID=543037 RepID=UPI0025DAC02E|nr:hypothetical protein [uncultured Rhodoblastus sp.]
MANLSKNRLHLFLLLALFIGSMSGAGIYFLLRNLAIATASLGAIIAWCMAVYTLARVFQPLAERKLNLDAGGYTYSRAGFGG